MSEDKINLPIDHLEPNPLQPRGVITPASLADLVESIKAHGVIQPLIVAHTPAGYQIIAGERRWRAAKLAGLTEVPAVIKETTPQGMLEMAIVENVQRTDLNPVDRAKSFERLLIEFNLNSAEVARRIGKSPSYISNSLRLLELPDALKDGLISNVISEGHARALAGIPSVAKMIEGYKMILKEGGSVRRAEEIARHFKKELESGGKGSKKEKATVNEDGIAKIIDGLQSFLGKNSKVKIRRSRVATSINITLRGNPEATEEQIQAIYAALDKKQEPKKETPKPEIIEPEGKTLQPEPRKPKKERKTEPKPETETKKEEAESTPPINPYDPISDDEDDW